MPREHTPGPWHADGTAVTARVGASERYVCELSTSAPAQGQTYRIEAHRAEFLANLALIAAAPDLLEELMDAAAQTQCGCGHPACRQCARDKRWHETIERALGHNNQVERQP